ncbi:hypothetical protein CsSME_00011775 [Camellia sinensis var. sinensis]
MGNCRKLQHQHPTGLDSRDPYDLQHGCLEILPKAYCGEGNWRNKLTCSKPLSSKVED